MKRHAAPGTGARASRNAGQGAAASRDLSSQPPSYGELFFPHNFCEPINTRTAKLSPATITSLNNPPRPFGTRSSRKNDSRHWRPRLAKGRYLEVCRRNSKEQARSPKAGRSIKLAQLRQQGTLLGCTDGGWFSKGDYCFGAGRDGRWQWVRHDAASPWAGSATIRSKCTESGAMVNRSLGSPDAPASDRL